MGNASSNKSGPASPNRMETPPDAGFRSGSSPNKLTPAAPKRKLSDAVDDGKRKLDKQMLCSALQARGECIAQSDLDNLPYFSSCME